jgi:hypothetical protein
VLGRIPAPQIPVLPDRIGTDDEEVAARPHVAVPVPAGRIAPSSASSPNRSPFTGPPSTTSARPATTPSASCAVLWK